MKLNHYLYSQFAITFFPIFLGLFFITSIVFLVKIASLTSIITIDFFELFRLFAYVVPQIIFYTMPISFFISMVITLAKLASEYELTVITSFGLNPVNILKIFLPLTLLLSALLLVVSVGLIPKTKFLTKQFLETKKKESSTKKILLTQYSCVFTVIYTYFLQSIESLFVQIVHLPNH